VIEHHLRGRDYNEALLPQWINDICESTMEELHAPKKPFKYVVSCCIMQRTGAGIHCAKACYWDTVSDASVTVAWPQRQVKDPNNRTMVCIVTVFAVSFYPSGI